MKKKVFILMRRSVYILLFAIGKVLKLRGPQVTILCYHSIDTDGWDFSVAPNDFKKQVKFLAKNYKFITLKELQDFLAGKLSITKPSILITFDDGYKNILKIKTFVKSLNIRPAVFLIGDTKNANYSELATRREFLNKNDVFALTKNGWAVGSHTSTHPDLLKLSPPAIKQEITGSKKSLEKNLGIKIKYIAYPRGKYDKTILNTAKKAGYLLGLTMNDGEITINTKPLEIPRIGVDGTHSFAEFKVLASPLVSTFRGFIKTNIL
jgi:peptidoglycan/xylan/chitin deacetylase (PgdA/CDA1 family)